MAGKGGRKPGVPNKSTLDLFAKCEAEGVDPFTGLLRLARDGAEESTRLGAYKELCKYLYPQRKAVEVSNPDGEGFRIIVEDYQGKK